MRNLMTALSNREMRNCAYISFNRFESLRVIVRWDLIMCRNKSVSCAYEGVIRIQWLCDKPRHLHGLRTDNHPLEAGASLAVLWHSKRGARFSSVRHCLRHNKLCDTIHVCIPCTFIVHNTLFCIVRLYTAETVTKLPYVSHSFTDWLIYFSNLIATISRTFLRSTLTQFWKLKIINIVIDSAPFRRTTRVLNQIQSYFLNQQCAKRRLKWSKTDMSAICFAFSLSFFFFSNESLTFFLY